MAKARLTLEQHRELGALLKQVRAGLVASVATVTGAFPKKAPVCRALFSAMRSLDNAKSGLDDQLLQEHPGAPDADVIYYGSAGGA